MTIPTIQETDAAKSAAYTALTERIIESLQTDATNWKYRKFFSDPQLHHDASGIKLSLLGKAYGVRVIAPAETNLTENGASYRIYNLALAIIMTQTTEQFE